MRRVWDEELFSNLPVNIRLIIYLATHMPVYATVRQHFVLKVVYREELRSVAVELAGKRFSYVSCRATLRPASVRQRDTMALVLPACADLIFLRSDGPP